ncbi:MAG: glycerol dehydrogenase [Candidatus Obscuribacterales bacterium]|nr:glycerol dehydrogenase [Candidatus Obscuribacterales bacterium]
MLSVFCAPARYVQGRHASASLGEEMKKLGLEGPVLIVAGGHAESFLSETWKKTFSGNGYTYKSIRFKGECSTAEINRCKAAAKDMSARVIIGAGGGKVLDTARAVASELDLPVVNCPSLASSDAPCSALSVLYTEDGQFQEYKFYKRNPDLVLVDTSLIARGPARLLVAGMGDALATWFEAKTVKDACKKNQLGGKTTISAEALAYLCYETLINDGEAALHAVRQQTVTPALERLVEANTLLSGLGFESGGLAVAHSVHNGLTCIPETHNYYHGEKVAFGLLVQLVLEGKESSLIEEVLQFSSSVGLPISLQDLGIYKLSKESCMVIAERASAPGETAHNEPFEINAEMLADAIRTADSIGTSFKALYSPDKSEACLALS